MNAFDIAAVTSELSDLIKGSRIGKIYQINRNILLLKLRDPNGEIRYLLIEAGRRIHVTKYDFEKPKMPPNFCMALRKYLENGVIEDVVQYDFERIVELIIRRGGRIYRLITELFAEGNIILVGSDNKILHALNYRKMRDRNIIRGEDFKYPPPRGKDLRHVTLKDIQRIKDFGKIEVVRALTRVLGVGGLYAEEILLRSSIDKNKPCLLLTDEDLTALLNGVREITSQIGSWKPCLYVDEAGEFIDVTPFPLKRYSGFSMIKVESFNEALDEYYAKVGLKSEIKGVEKIVEREIANLTRILREQEERLRELSEKSRIYRQMGEKIFAHLHEIDFLINRVMDEKRSGKNWEEIFKSMLKDKAITPSIRFLSINPKNLTLQVSVDGQFLDLNLRLSAQQNAAKYYERAKKMEEKIKGLEKAMEETKRKILEKRAEAEKKADAAKLPLMVRRKKEWYEKFRWFFSSEGFLVIGGRDAGTNEVIIKKYMEPRDIVLHADIPGSPFTVIKTQGKTPSEKTLREAAQFTASYSRAWKENLRAIDVYWIKPEQVSKKPPSGEYLPRGSFMIYGTKNYIRGVPLEVAIGVKREGDLFKVIGGPPEAVSKQTRLYVKIVPGKEPSGRLAKNIRFILANMAPLEDQDKILRIAIEDIQAFIPSGRGSISLEKGR